VPESGSLLGDGRPYRRFAKERITERETLALIGQALDARVRLIFVEANPLLFDFAFAARQRPCDGWKAAARAFVIDQRDRLRAAYHQSSLPAVQTADPDPELMDARHRIDMAVVETSYPLLLRAPCEPARLKALADRARALGACIVLFLPPRSPFATARIGRSTDAALRTDAQQLAERLGVELFAPADAWSDDEFVDAAHVNATGREHFLAALRHWWATRQ
jgi:hypothetical protein